jgi:hypothetical protein
MAVLVAALEARPGDCDAFRLHAVRVLVTACYVYTGRIVPQPLRARLLLALRNRLCHGEEGALVDIGASAIALALVLSRDEVFAPLVSRDQVLAAMLTDIDGEMEAVMQRLVGHCLLQHECGWLFACSHQNCPPGDAMRCAAALQALASMAVRGGGLVASAYGMLHCRDTVALLVERWRGSSLSNRLDTARDVLVHLATIPEIHWDEASSSSDRVSRLGEARAQACFTPEAKRHYAVHTAQGLAATEAVLRAAQPDCPDSSRTVLVSLTVLVPHSVNDCQSELASNVADRQPGVQGAGAERSTAVELERSLPDSVLPEIAALVAPLADALALLFGPFQPVEVTLAPE